MWSSFFCSFQRFCSLAFVLGVIAGQAVTDWLAFSLILETFLSKPGCNLGLFDFNPLYFHDNPFEQQHLNEFCPLVAP